MFLLMHLECNDETLHIIWYKYLASVSRRPVPLVIQADNGTGRCAAGHCYDETSCCKRKFRFHNSFRTIWSFQGECSHHQLGFRPTYLLECLKSDVNDARIGVLCTAATDGNICHVIYISCKINSS